MNIDLTLLFLKIFISSASTGPPRPPVQSKVLTLSIFFYFDGTPYGLDVRQPIRLIQFELLVNPLTAGHAFSCDRQVGHLTPLTSFRETEKFF